MHFLSGVDRAGYYMLFEAGPIEWHLGSKRSPIIIPNILMNSLWILCILLGAIIILRRFICSKFIIDGNTFSFPKNFYGLPTLGSATISLDDQRLQVSAFTQGSFIRRWLDTGRIIEVTGDGSVYKFHSATVKRRDFDRIAEFFGLRF